VDVGWDGRKAVVATRLAIVANTTTTADAIKATTTDIAR
jgi:hypothetical protein